MRDVELVVTGLLFVEGLLALCVLGTVGHGVYGMNGVVGMLSGCHRRRR